MPFIDSKVNIKTTLKQQKELKTRLGQAVSLIPGKSESWLMINLEDDRKMYFRGDDSEPLAFICINYYGSADESALWRSAWREAGSYVCEICSVDVLGMEREQLLG